MGSCGSRAEVDLSSAHLVNSGLADRLAHYIRTEDAVPTILHLRRDYRDHNLILVAFEA